MPRGKKGTRKGTKKGKPTGATRRAPRESGRIPKIAPFITKDIAGGAQTGVRVGFPASRKVRLAYVENATLTSAYGAIAKSAFRLNGAYDPWITSTGHQPMGFDQWAAFYNHYCVHAASWTLTVAPLSGALGVGYIGAHYSDDTTIPSDVSTLVELGSQVSLFANGQRPQIFRGHIDISRFFNRKGDISNDDQLRAAVTADPVEQAVLTAWAMGESAVASITYGYLLEIEYDVTFMEPKDLGPSRTSATFRMEHTAQLGPDLSVQRFHHDVAEGLLDPPTEPAGFAEERGHAYSIHDAQRIWSDTESRKALTPREEAARANRDAYEARAAAIRAATDADLAGTEYRLVTRKGSRSGSGRSPAA